jgi:hypothetical protein
VLRYYDSTGAAIAAKPHDVLSVINPTTSWAQSTLVVTTPAGTTQVKVQPDAVYFSGWINYDDVALIKAGTTVNLVPDSGFELGTGWAATRGAFAPATGFQRGGMGLAHSGTYGYAIHNQAYGQVTTTNFITASPSASYTLSAWVRGEVAADSNYNTQMGRLTLYYAVVTVLVLLASNFIPQFKDYLPIGGAQNLLTGAGHDPFTAIEIGASSVEDLEGSLLWLVFAVLGAILTVLPMSWTYMALRSQEEYDQSLVAGVGALEIALVMTVIFNYCFVALWATDFGARKGGHRYMRHANAGKGEESGDAAARNRKKERNGTAAKGSPDDEPEGALGL